MFDSGTSDAEKKELLEEKTEEIKWSDVIIPAERQEAESPWTLCESITDHMITNLDIYSELL